jgi:hypothetical protein
MVYRPQQTLHQRKYIHDKLEYEKMFHIICHQRITNKNNNETLLHIYSEAKMQNTDSVGKDNTKLWQLLFISGGNANATVT